MDAPPAKLSLVERTTAAARRRSRLHPKAWSRWSAIVTCRDARLAPVLARLAAPGVTWSPDAAAGMALRRTLARRRDARHARRAYLHAAQRQSCTRRIPSCTACFHASARSRRWKRARRPSANVLAAGQAQVTRRGARNRGAPKRAHGFARQTVADAQQRHHALQMEALRLSEQAQRLKHAASRSRSELVEIEEQNESRVRASGGSGGEPRAARA